MATRTLNNQETEKTTEHQSGLNFHNILDTVKERFASLLTDLYGPPKTQRNRMDDELFTTRLDRWYPRA